MSKVTKAAPASRACRVVFATARKINNDSTAYSDTCAVLRMTNCTCSILAGEMPGWSHRKIGPIMREVCSADIRSVEPTKIRINQITIGSQYFKNFETSLIARSIMGRQCSRATVVPLSLQPRPRLVPRKSSARHQKDNRQRARCANRYQ